MAGTGMANSGSRSHDPSSAIRSSLSSTKADSFGTTLSTIFGEKASDTSRRSRACWGPLVKTRISIVFLMNGRSSNPAPPNPKPVVKALDRSSSVQPAWLDRNRTPSMLGWLGAASRRAWYSG